jgi:hypothetical protein
MTMPPAGPLPRASGSRHSIEVDVHASVGIVRPGDKLVIATGRHLDMHEAEQLMTRLREQLPGVEIVPVEASALIVYRDEARP